MFSVGKETYLKKRLPILLGMHCSMTWKKLTQCLFFLNPVFDG
jgi:hypothetical protein